MNFKSPLRIATFLLLFLSVAMVSISNAGDPLGVETLKGDPGLAVDFVWVLICGFLVMFMQAGFACVESGFCRSKT